MNFVEMLETVSLYLKNNHPLCLMFFYEYLFYILKVRKYWLNTRFLIISYLEGGLLKVKNRLRHCNSYLRRIIFKTGKTLNIARNTFQSWMTNSVSAFSHSKKESWLGFSRTVLWTYRKSGIHDPKVSP